MAKFSPQFELFKITNRLSTINQNIFWFILLLSIIPVIFKDNGLILQSNDLLNILNIILLCVFFTVESIIDLILLPQADSKRRDDFIDNSFGTKLSPTNSVDFYDNDEINTGLYKTAVNLFENCFFTYSLVKLLTTKKIIWPIVLLFVSIVLAFYGFKNVPFALTILQTLFSANILGALIKHLILINRLSTIFEGWLLLFQNPNIKANTVDFQPLIYKFWLQYETLLSKINAGVPNSIFNNQNERLTKEWKELKVKYNIS